MICWAFTSRSLRGFSVMNRLPLLPALPLPPIAIAVLAVAGSACTMSTRTSIFAFIAAKEMSCEASAVAVIRPLSCCGKNPLGMTINR